jgi:hypothetical protein
LKIVPFALVEGKREKKLSSWCSQPYKLNHHIFGEEKDLRYSKRNQPLSLFAKNLQAFSTQSLDFFNNKRK